MNILAVLEGFWVDYGTIISAVSAGVVLIGAVITFFKNNSLSKESVDRTAQAETKLGGDHQHLSADHQHLAADHQHLSADHQILLKYSADVNNSIVNLKQPLEFLRDAQIKEDARREAAKGQTLDMQKMLDILSAHQRHVQEMEQKVQRLEAENQRLEAENQRLRDRFGLADEAVRRQRSELGRDREADEQEL